MAALTFELATTVEDADLRRLLGEHPVTGALTVSFEREPSYFGAALEGQFQQTLIGRDQTTTEIVAMGSRSVRPLYVNGAVQSVGYLSQLRVRPGRLNSARSWSAAFAFLRSLHADGRTPFYFTSIVDDNQPARRLLTAGLPGFPVFRDYASLHTFAVWLGRPKQPVPLPFPLRLERGTARHVDAIVACLQRSGVRRQLTPFWSAESLFVPEQTPNLRPENFFLAMDGDRVVGCLAWWDQSGFKQGVVRGYAGTLGRWRPVINLTARVGGWPTLPPPHTPLRYCYASHLAIDEDEPIVFSALLRALYTEARRQGLAYVMLGLGEGDALASVVTSSYRHTTYASRLYLVAWEEGLNAIAGVDHRVPRPEIAIL